MLSNELYLHNLSTMPKKKFIQLLLILSVLTGLVVTIKQVFFPPKESLFQDATVYGNIKSILEISYQQNR